MQRRKHEMAGFGGCQNHCHGLGIAHLAHQNDIGILPQDAAQRAGEVGRILADFDLLDDGFAVGMHVLDGIFDGHDVIVTRVVDQIDQRGERGAFPASGRSRDQNQTLAGFRKTPQSRRQVQRFERRNFFRQQADAARDGAALVVNVGAETPDAVAAEAEVDGLVAAEFLRLRGGHQRQQQIARSFGGERRTGGMRKRAADAQCHGDIGDQQQIGSAEAHGVSEHGVERGKIAVVKDGSGLGAGVARTGNSAVQLSHNLREFILVARHLSSILLQTLTALREALRKGPGNSGGVAFGLTFQFVALCGYRLGKLLVGAHIAEVEIHAEKHCAHGAGEERGGGSDIGGRQAGHESGGLCAKGQATHSRTRRVHRNFDGFQRSAGRHVCMECADVEVGKFGQTRRLEACAIEKSRDILALARYAEYLGQ